MTKKINLTSPHENLIIKWMSWCDRVFHWVIALVVLFMFAGLFMSGTTIGWSLLVMAGSLFSVIIVPFVLIKLFMPDLHPKDHLNVE